MDLIPGLWSEKRILVTGHTGFKGSWLVFWLEKLGAKVIGLSLPPVNLSESLYKHANIQSRLASEYFLDISNNLKVEKAIKNSQPDYVFHLAAQAIVSNSLKNPRESILTNVVGTTNVLISSLSLESLMGITLVTSDKVYRNNGSNKPFVEGDELGGIDPYSSSKAATELIASSLVTSCNPFKTSVTTVRAGNVIGGGDFGKDRLIPDLFKAIKSNKTLEIRNLNSTRPWQYILDCLNGYMLVAQNHMTNKSNSVGTINFGPNKSLSVQDVIETFQSVFKKNISYRVAKKNFIEEPRLEISSQLAHKLMGWQTLLSPKEAIIKTADWYLQFYNGANANDLMSQEISNYTREYL